MAPARHKGYNRTWTPESHDHLAHMWCLLGLTYEEIGAILGHTPKAVHQQINMLGLRLTPQAIAIRRARGIQRGGTKASRALSKGVSP